MAKYQLRLSSKFKKALKKYSKKNKQLQKKVIEVLDIMSRDPFDRTLRTHKVTNPRFSHAWSSRVTGDVRIIWDFDEDENAVILLFEVGGHDDVY
jgi:mRNA-degrading endonuclease YafQ of YafQ-DinJ toxin-antitoxin module